MLNLNLKEVLQLSRKYNVIPVFAQTSADMETPLSAYMKIDNPEYSFLLESVEGGENTARYSFLGGWGGGRARTLARRPRAPPACL